MRSNKGTKRGYNGCCCCCSVFYSSFHLLFIILSLLFLLLNRTSNNNQKHDRQYYVVESFAQIRQQHQQQQQPPFKYGWNKITSTPVLTRKTTNTKPTKKDHLFPTNKNNNNNSNNNNNPRSINHIVHDDTFQLIPYNLQAAIPIRFTPRQRDGNSFEHLLQSRTDSSSSSSNVVSTTTTITEATTSSISPSPLPTTTPTTTNTPSFLSYAEQSRPYRRTEYTTESWIQHRFSRRFTGNLFDILKTGILKSLLYHIFFVTQIAIFICCYNGCFINGYTDWYGMFHRPIYTSKFLPLLRVPIDFYTFTTPVLGLVLVFKIDTAYRRWDEASKCLTSIVNGSRNIMMDTITLLSKMKQIPNVHKEKYISRIEQALWSFIRSIPYHFYIRTTPTEVVIVEHNNNSNNSNKMNTYEKECYERLRSDYANDLIKSKHKPSRALYELSCALNEVPFHQYDKKRLDVVTSQLNTAFGNCESIFLFPVPQAHSIHVRQFLTTYVLCLPFVLYDMFGHTWNHWGMIPVTAHLTFFLLSIEELSRQLEEPLSLLPFHSAITNHIGKVTNEIKEFRIQDEEKERYKKKQQQQAQQQQEEKEDAVVVLKRQSKQKKEQQLPFLQRSKLFATKFYTTRLTFMRQSS